MSSPPGPNGSKSVAAQTTRSGGPEGSGYYSGPGGKGIVLMWTQTRAPGCADGLWDRGARELGWRRDSRAAPYPACPRAPLTDLSLAGYKTGAKAWIPQFAAL